MVASEFTAKIAKLKTALENVFLKKNLGSSNGGKSVATDSNGNIITEAKNNHTHNYIPNNADGSTTGNLTATTSGKGIITANSFKKNGGTSSQFLKADGSVDSNSYSKTSHNHGTINGGVLGVNLVEDSDGQYVYGFSNKIIYDVNDSDKLFYDKNNSSMVNEGDEIATLDDIENSEYTHPSYTARTGKPTGNQTPAFGGTATVSQITSDATGHVTGATDRTIKIPNTLANGTTAGLSTNDYTTTEKTKLGNIAENANNYSHPTSYGAKTGVPTANTTIGSNGQFTVSQPTSDASGHVTALNTRTYTIPTASSSTNGLMTTTQNDKLAGIANNANNYSHPTNLTALSSGLYKITTNNNGHVTAGTAVTSTDIANLGVKITDTTYTAATATPNPDLYTGSVGSSAKYAKEDHTHPVINSSCPNGNNTDWYLKIMTVKVTGTYMDKVIAFDVIARRPRLHHVEISFVNQGNTDPQVRKLVVSGGDSRFWVAKSDTSTWDIYVKKQELYDGVNITHLQYGNEFNITFPNTVHTDLPTTDILEALYERDNIGINLLKGTKDFSGCTTSAQNGNTPLITTESELYNGCVVKKITNSSSFYQDLGWDIPKEWLELGGIYTLSFWAKTDTTHGYVNTYFYQSNITAKRLKSNGVIGSWTEGAFGDGATQFYPNQGWQRYYVTYQLLNSGTFNSNKKIIIRLLSNSGSGQNVYIAGFKLEKGDQATKYSESPFDAKLTASQSVATDASGNIITEAKNNHTHSYISTTAGSVGTTNLANNSVTNDKLVATIIPNGTSTAHNSLDNYTKLGFYYQSTNTNTSYIDKLPEPGKAFWLFVEDWGSSNYTKQTVTHYNSNSTYTRIRNNNNWGRWTKLENNHEYIAGTQTASTGAWTGTSKYIDDLRAGTRIYYKLPYAGSGNATLTLTLSDGTTVAKDVYYNNTTRMTTHFPANTVIPLVYDGTKWVSTMIQNTNYYDRLYSIGQVVNGESSQLANGTIICGKSDKKYYKLASGLVFDVRYPIFHLGGNLNSEANTNNVYLFYGYTNIQVTIPSKTVTNLTEVFIEGTTFTNNQFTVSSNIVVSDGSFTSGRFYIPIGMAYSNTNIRFNGNINQIFYYNGTNLIPIEDYKYSTTSHNHSGTYVDGAGTKNSTNGSAIAEIKANTTVKGTIYHPKVNTNALTGVPTANTTIGSASTFTVSQPSVNTDGHVTALTTRTYTLPTGSTSQKGILQIGIGSGNAAAGNHTHDYIPNTVSSYKFEKTDINQSDFNSSSYILFKKIGKLVVAYCRILSTNNLTTSYINFNASSQTVPSEYRPPEERISMNHCHYNTSTPSILTTRFHTDGTITMRVNTSSREINSYFTVVYVTD